MQQGSMPGPENAGTAEPEIQKGRTGILAPGSEREPDYQRQGLRQPAAGGGPKLDDRL